MPDLAKIRKRHEAALLRRQNVVLVGEGSRDGEDVIVVGVSRKLPEEVLEPADVVPKALNNVPTQVREVGEIKALAARTERWRPAPGGVSIGHADITAGTLGIVVRRLGVDAPLVLSNNHVLANSNAGVPGDAILQPGAYDGGTNPADRIGSLLDFVPVEFGGAAGCSVANLIVRVLNGVAALFGRKTRLEVQANPNLVDAALCLPVDRAALDPRVLDSNDQPTQEIKQTTEVSVGDAVHKTGRTTGYQAGQVSIVGATVSVSYGAAGTATFADQIVVGTPGFSAGGDSGSAVLSGTSLAGLLFAGSDQITIANRIANVFDALGLEL